MRKQLMEILTQEKQKVSELKNILKIKRNLIEKNDALSLKGILEKESKLVDVLNHLENERMKITNELSKKYGTNPTISDILIHIEEPMRHDLTVLSAKLTELLNEVSLLNLGIQQMIAYRLEEFDVLMDAIRGKKATYDEYESDRKGTVFNRRA